MPVEAEQTNYDHIGDAETVYITHPDTAGVGTAPGAAFKLVWAPKGWVQTTREAYEAHLEDMREQVGQFIAAGDAEMPPAEGDAQDIINAELRGDVAPKRHAGGATSAVEKGV
jgi:hypothetical protein